MEKFNNWSDEDLEMLDRKFDALCEHLNVEFTYQTVSDGSDIGDHVDLDTVKCRKKKRTYMGFPMFSFPSAESLVKEMGNYHYAFDLAKEPDKAFMVKAKRKPDGSIEIIEAKEI